MINLRFYPFYNWRWVF